ncbi:hypothetical protein IFM53868_07721 [Aspergillus udagawae]|uniref:FAD-binding domain-containing protein n=1 Tax=Aspergillus udagawae TaxID=91492 RepID=A0ABQ1B6T1_9EURO|nr:hypothetical protein IFM53868_07721 [Aspergillus udagawae]
MTNHDWETTNILICGCGPTGALLSAYLGQMHISKVVLEKEANITTDLRGIALDEDGIRILQGVGLYDSVYTEIGSCMGKFYFISGSSTNLMKQEFVSMDYNTTYCTYRNAKGTERKIRARFFVGADGKTGFTRKRYLEEKGVFMEKVTDVFYDETWVALNWEITLPTPQNQPDFPLWNLGYTPEQVYDLFFPRNFCFLCNPNRPAVRGRFGPPNDRLWRFEFFGQPHEDRYHMATREMVQKIVFLYITHSGSQYGLSGDVQFPEDCIDIL